MDEKAMIEQELSNLLKRARHFEPFGQSRFLKISMVLPLILATNLR